MDIKRKADLFHAEEQEIRDYFRSAVFRGVYRKATQDEKDRLDWICGCIENISLNGRSGDLCPSWQPVPGKFNSLVSEGLCEFTATVDERALRTRDKYQLLVQTVKNIEVQNVPRNVENEEIFCRNLRLRDKKFVGRFVLCPSGSFAIEDIRRSDFSKLILQNGKPQPPIECKPETFAPRSGTYYEFSWVLHDVGGGYSYTFGVDESAGFVEITPRDVIKRLNEEIMRYPAGAAQKIVKMLDTLKNQLTASGKEIFIYELLQNANDYPLEVCVNGGAKKKLPVDVEFHLTKTSLLFMHTGELFNEKNVAAICSINDKEKDTNRGAIGYKGIGFKTVFLDNEKVYLQSGGYSFRFDREYSRDIVDTPWQILPVWTKFQELTSEERAIFARAKDFNVKFALTPTNDAMVYRAPRNYAQMFREVFANERVILFVPNLRSVRVYTKGTSVPDIVCIRGDDKWRVDDYEEAVDPSVTESINESIDEQEDTGSLKIPTKYYDFKKTKVSFACEIEGRKLKPVLHSCLYCYLPAKNADWGLKFLMNTDMIPNGQRDDVEVDFDKTVNVNEVISRIAGEKFFDWIRDLCASGRYELDSVFQFVPEFLKIKDEKARKYEALIDAFRNGFETRLRDEPIVPIQGENELSLVRDVVLDETGLSSSGVMTDSEFLSFANLPSKQLPVSELRGASSFNQFLSNYLDCFSEKRNIFSKKSLCSMIRQDAFKDWLKVQDNNDRFLRFLLEKGYFEDFIDEEIFIDEECGDLYKAEDLYFDVDEELEDLRAFSRHMRYLSLKTRKCFGEDERWLKVCADTFNRFDVDDFVEKTLLSDGNWDETIRLLHDQETSIHFYQFLAKTEHVPSRLEDLPFFGADQIAVENFKDKIVFFDSDEGKKVCDASWLSPVAFSFLLPRYGEVVDTYLEKNCGVRYFSVDVIVNDVILDEDYCLKVNAAQQSSFDVSKCFVDFCFKHRDCFSGVASLSQYALRAVDGHGEFCWILPSDDHVYFVSSAYSEFSKRRWLGVDWMYCLDEGYLISAPVEKKDFIREKFGVAEISSEKFYREVVRRHKEEIINNTSGDNDPDGEKNFDFVTFLDENYDLIFGREKDADKFSGFVLLADGKEGGFCDIDRDNSYLYLDDASLTDIVGSPWFPKGLVSVCSSRYGESMALAAIGARTFKIGEFFDDVVIGEFATIQNAVDTKEKSIAFHEFVFANKNDLTNKQIEVMKQAPVYLYGQEESSPTSSGHRVLSSKARELQERGLVEFSALDIISPEYHPEDNADYWETLLGNAKFTVVDFVNWAKDRQDEFGETIRDLELNVSYWRWLKDGEVSDETIKALPPLPIALKCGTMAVSNAVIYLSDEYIQGGIEALVKNFNPDAAFVSPAYLGEDTDIESWRNFWSRVGVRYDILGILRDVIDNRLGEIEDAKLVSTIAMHRSELEQIYGEELLAKLADLRLRSRDGRFLGLRDVIYIDCERAEPFPCVELPNQVFYATSDERRLISDVLNVVGGCRIDTVQDWRRAKILRYLEIQDDASKIDILRSLHYTFVDELATLFGDGIANLEFDSEDESQRLELVRKVRFLDRANHFVPAEGLTEGSVYAPFCDFERCGLSYEYLSDSYKTSCTNDLRKMLKSVFRIHCDFQEQDIPQLTYRAFAIYFWKDYLPNADSIWRIRGLIEDRKFDSVACIPTKDYMKHPSEVYSPCKDMSYFVGATDDFENKMRLKELPEVEYEQGRTLFGLLFDKKENLQLSFEDSLYALFKIVGKDKRTKLLEWMIDSYGPEYTENIRLYREDEGAKWKNTKNYDVHITKLYALAYGDKILDQYFGTLPQIINPDYLPGGDNFEKACKILGITVIGSRDIVIEPQDACLVDVRIELYIKSLALAYCLDAENWKVKYDEFKQLINNAGFYRCASLSVRYREDKAVCQERKKFFRKENESAFYFVESLDDKRVFTQFVGSFIDYLGLKLGDLDSDLVETIMDSKESAVEWLQENNNLMVDPVFQHEMKLLLPDAIDRFVGNQANEDDVVDDGRRHVIKVANNQPDEDPIRTGTSPTGLSQDDLGWADDETSAEAIRGSDGDGSNAHSNGRDHSAVGPASSDGAEVEQVGRLPEEEEDFLNESSDDDEDELEGDVSAVGLESGEAPHRVEGGSSRGGSGRSVGSERKRRPFSPPKPFSEEDVKKFGSHGRSRCLGVSEPTQPEVETLNGILEGNLTPEQVADQNYLAQLRLYNNLKNRGMDPEETLEDFVKDGVNKHNHPLKGGKYIHKCSAAAGILYLSPSIWNKLADDRCVVCVYLGARANDFMYINSIQDILDWIEEDDILIKMTGEEKVRAVNALYKGVLNGVKGTAYTMLRIQSDEHYNSLFEPLDESALQGQTDSQEDY